MDNPIQADTPTSTDSRLKIRSAKRRHKKENDKIRKYIYDNKDNDEELIDASIILAEDKYNSMAKNNMNNVRRVTIDADNTATRKKKQQPDREEKNMGNALSTDTQHLINSMTRDGKHIQFRSSPTVTTYYHDD